ncbi:MAG: hypothetical protein KBD78_02350 [Oligoflexales bacterium]|nr:hypothetical protein [Oligoflexales bacterium]
MKQFLPLLKSTLFSLTVLLPHSLAQGIEDYPERSSEISVHSDIVVTQCELLTKSNGDALEQSRYEFFTIPSINSESIYIANQENYHHFKIELIGNNIYAEEIVNGNILGKAAAYIDSKGTSSLRMGSSETNINQLSCDFKKLTDFPYINLSLQSDDKKSIKFGRIKVSAIKLKVQGNLVPCVINISTNSHVSGKYDQIYISSTGIKRQKVEFDSSGLFSIFLHSKATTDLLIAIKNDYILSDFSTFQQHNINELNFDYSCMW